MVGVRPPELVFLHGGGQTAHTWDLVLTRLGRPVIAIDLPAHGQSVQNTLANMARRIEVASI
jgi:pimeloyl-ACP methyl ester carboxylesterase